LVLIIPCHPSLNPPPPLPTLHLWDWLSNSPFQDQPTSPSALFLVHTLPQPVLSASRPCIRHYWRCSFPLWQGVLDKPVVLTAVSHAVTTLLLIASVAHSLSASSGLLIGSPIPVVPGRSHNWLFLLTLVALAARSFPPCFLLASSTHNPLQSRPGSVPFFPPFPTTLSCRWRQHSTTWHHNPEDLDLKHHHH
jgi:hypothetical protein